MSRPWLEEDRQLINSLAGVKPVAEISRRTGRTLTAVWKYASKHGISLAVIREFAHWTVSEEQIVTLAISQGKTPKDVYRELHRHTRDGVVAKFREVRRRLCRSSL